MDMLSVAMVTAQVVGLYLLADLVGGIFHWAEDTLGDVDTPFWGPIFVRPNVTHHEEPSRMMKQHWLPNNVPIAIGTLLILSVVWILDAMTWQWLVFGAFGGMNQQVHRFAHAPRLRLSESVKFLQRIKVLQDARHHWGHHRSPHTTRYCVMTPWVNPVLDRIGFWRAAERVFVPVFGAPRRPDLADKLWYRA